MLERWGSLSVSDHVDTNAVIANVLLYDRLIVPVMTAQPDRDEFEYWNGRGWQPDLQRKRLDQLGHLAVKRPWDRHRRAAFQTRYAQLAAERADADAMALQLTRRILANEPVERPAGVQGVEVVAAYSSLSALPSDFDVQEATDHAGAQALLLTRQLRVPAEKDPEDSLRVAIELSRDPDFRGRRSDLFDWQNTARIRQLQPKDAVDYLVELVGHYNKKVEEASAKVGTRFAFTIAGGLLGFATGGPIGAAAGATLSLLQFVTLDREPAIEQGSLAPVAMFHDIEVKLGYRLGAA